MPSKDEGLRELKFKWAVEDHPEVAQAIRDGDYWVHPDGTIDVHVKVADCERNRVGVRRWSDVLGIPLSETEPAASPPSPPPGPMLSFEEALELSRTRRCGG